MQLLPKTQRYWNSYLKNIFREQMFSKNRIIIKPRIVFNQNDAVANSSRNYWYIANVKIDVVVLNASDHSVRIAIGLHEFFMMLTRKKDIFSA
eukprot:snap_masked-scaffold_4-processed-gene-19.28-mRNA-1 protein AED:1.00 eAED:1.00 QI:0/-1/0/0/-1/1/1/0/92